MKVLVTSRGSRGDVHPLIEIGAAFKRAGHDVAVCVPPNFAAACRERGLAPSFYSEDSAAVMDELGSGWRGLSKALDWFSRSINEQFDFMLRESADADVMVTSVNEVAAPTVARYRDIPHYRIAYTPVLPGSHPPPLVPWQGLPAPLNRGLWGLVNAGAGLFIRRRIDEKRRELGMPPIDGVVRYFTEHSHTVLTLNRTLAPPCPSWGGRYRYSYSGYCYGAIDGPLDAGLGRFLDAGPRPVYLGFGSVSLKDPGRFTDMVLEAVHRAGVRAVLGAGWTGLGREGLPAGVHAVGDTHHATLFPRCAGIAHHGGSGTLHTGARAGVPQFIMPQIADQFYWGHRVERLGLGPAPVAPGKISVQKLAGALAAMAGEKEYARNAQALGEEMRGEDGVPAVVSLVTSEVGGRSNASVKARGRRHELSGAGR